MNTTGIEVLRPLPREATKKGLEEKIKRKTRLRVIYFTKFRGQKLKYIQDRYSKHDRCPTAFNRYKRCNPCFVSDRNYHKFYMVFPRERKL